MGKLRDWATENINRDWSDIVFSDEESFWAWVSVKRAWSHRWMHLVQHTVKYLVKIHVCGCYSERAFGCLELFTENLKAQIMLIIYRRRLISSVKRCLDRKTKMKYCKRIMLQNTLADSALTGRGKTASRRWNGHHNRRMKIRSKMCWSFWSPNLKENNCEIWSSPQ